MAIPLDTASDPAFADERPVHFLARDYPAGHSLAPHCHQRAQLVYAVRGVLTVGVPALGSWTVPPERAVWIPAAVVHEVRCVGATRMRTLYVDAPARTKLPQSCRVVAVSSLLRELILHLGRLQGARAAPSPEETRAARVALDLIDTLEVEPLYLARPTDARLLRVVEALERNPADARGIEEWARVAAASPRTFARHFRRATGQTFGAWRQQLRLLRALERLAAGEAVTNVALDVGYDSPSAFIRLFKHSFGVSPSRYFEDSISA